MPPTESTPLERCLLLIEQTGMAHYGLAYAVLETVQEERGLSRKSKNRDLDAAEKHADGICAEGLKAQLLYLLNRLSEEKVRELIMVHSPLSCRLTHGQCSRPWPSYTLANWEDLVGKTIEAIGRGQLEEAGDQGGSVVFFFTDGTRHSFWVDD